MLGLPVLPGIVVPAELSNDALERARVAFTASGSGGARLAAMDAPFDARLFAEIRELVAGFGPCLVVRSSCALESKGVWSGAFASYVGVAAEQLEVAIRGCWASVYSRDVLERCENEGIDPATIRLAVLVQPAIAFAAGGSARLESDAAVRISATRGAPAALMSGWVSGADIAVAGNDRITANDRAGLESEQILEVARLARRVQHLACDDFIEWGYAADCGVVLLQSRTSPNDPAAARRDISPAAAGADAAAAIRVARLVRRFPGLLVEEAVLPWGVLSDDVPLPAEIPPVRINLAETLREAQFVAGQLAGRAWELPVAKALERASREIDNLRRGVPAEDIARRAALCERVDPALTRRLIALVRGLGAALVELGMLEDETYVWRHSFERLAQLARGEPLVALDAGDRKGALHRDRWEPFIFATVAAYGEHRCGDGVVPGVGAGRARYLDVPSAAPAENDRKILIVPDPLPTFAPLLWNAAGLVSLTGGAGAHLMEVARSLGVPSVLRAKLDDVVMAGAHNFLLAVDGNAGFVSVLSG